MLPERSILLETPLVSHVELSGFRDVSSLIHLFVGGFELHGAKVGSTDDLDLYGVFVAPPCDVIGVQRTEHFIWSTASDDRRNGPDDVDLTLYSLKKWGGMAARGNATALHFLFAKATATSHPVWDLIQQEANLFLSKRSAMQFWALRTTSFDGSQGLKDKEPMVGDRSTSAFMATIVKRQCTAFGFT